MHNAHVLPNEGLVDMVDWLAGYQGKHIASNKGIVFDIDDNVETLFLHVFKFACAICNFVASMLVAVTNMHEFTRYIL